MDKTALETQKLLPVVAYLQKKKKRKISQNTWTTLKYKKAEENKKKFFYYKVDTRAYIRNEKSFFESHHIHKHYTNI